MLRLSMLFSMLICCCSAATIEWQPLYEPGSGGAITSLAVSPYNPKRILLGGDMLGIGLSLNQGETWEATYGLKNWEIGALTWHPSNPDIAWAGTMGGPYVSKDGGKNWMPSRNGFPPVAGSQYSTPVEKILFDPNNEKRLLALGGSRRRWGGFEKGHHAIWESQDGGDNWKELSVIVPDANILAASFAANSSDIIYTAVDGKGVYKSIDGGKSWTVKKEGLPNAWIQNLRAHTKDPGTLWVSLTGAGVYKSSDGAESWKPATEGLAPKKGPYFGLALCSAAPDTLITCDFHHMGGTIFKSSDGGASWAGVLNNSTFKRAYAAGNQMSMLEFDPQNPDVAFGGNTETVTRTLDGGKSWVDVTSFQPEGSTGWRGRGYSGLCTRYFQFDPALKDHVVFVSMDNGNFWQSTDGMKSWIWGGQGIPTWGCTSAMCFAGKEGKVMYLTLDKGNLGRMAKTVDSGKTWTKLSEDTLPKGKTGRVHALVDDPNKVWVLLEGKLAYSTDGGQQWKVVLEAPGLAALGVTPKAPLCFYVGSEKGVYKTEDGEHFTLLPNSPTNATWISISLNGIEPAVLFVSTKGTGYRCDKGEWSKIREDATLRRMAGDPGDPRRVIATSSDNPYHDISFGAGVWFSEDGGKTWVLQNTGLAMLRGAVIEFNPHDPEQIVYGTNGRGYFTARWTQK